MATATSFRITDPFYSHATGQGFALRSAKLAPNSEIESKRPIEMATASDLG
jgi:hypothetical protein